MPVVPALAAAAGSYIGGTALGYGLAGSIIGGALGGGIGAEASGGEFGKGALLGGLGGFAGPLSGALGGGVLGNAAARGILGGVGSAATGGDFGKGVLGGLVSYGASQLGGNLLGNPDISFDASQLAQQGIGASQIGDILAQDYGVGQLGGTAMGALATSGITDPTMQSMILSGAKGGIGGLMSGNVGQGVLGGMAGSLGNSAISGIKNIDLTKGSISAPIQLADSDIEDYQGNLGGSQFANTNHDMGWWQGDQSPLGLGNDNPNVSTNHYSPPQVTENIIAPVQIPSSIYTPINEGNDLSFGSLGAIGVDGNYQFDDQYTAVNQPDLLQNLILGEQYPKTFDPNFIDQNPLLALNYGASYTGNNATGANNMDDWNTLLDAISATGGSDWASYAQDTPSADSEAWMIDPAIMEELKMTNPDAYDYYTFGDPYGNIDTTDYHNIIDNGLGYEGMLFDRNANSSGGVLGELQKILKTVPGVKGNEELIRQLVQGLLKKQQVKSENKSDQAYVTAAQNTGMGVLPNTTNRSYGANTFGASYGNPNKIAPTVNGIYAPVSLGQRRR